MRNSVYRFGWQNRQVEDIFDEVMADAFTMLRLIVGCHLILYRGGRRHKVE